MKAIVLGTGIDRLGFLGFERKTISGPFGEAECFIRDDLALIPRHGKEHKVAPHLINYRANIDVMRSLGVDEAIALYAVGSITDRLLPGECGIVSDFIDMSHSRSNSFNDGTIFPLQHEDMDAPFSSDLVNRVLSLDPSLRRDLVYVTTQGPRLETKAEITAYERLGADVVGMTLATEASLIRELGIRNCALCYSINMAAGKGQEGMSFIGDEETERISSHLLHLAMEALAHVC